MRAILSAPMTEYDFTELKELYKTEIHNIIDSHWSKAEYADSSMQGLENPMRAFFRPLHEGETVLTRFQSDSFNRLYTLVEEKAEKDKLAAAAENTSSPGFHSSKK